MSWRIWSRQRGAAGSGIKANLADTVLFIYGGKGKSLPERQRTAVKKSREKQKLDALVFTALFCPALVLRHQRQTQRPFLAGRSGFPKSQPAVLEIGRAHV